MKYSLFILRRAQKELGHISEPYRSLIIKAINQLGEEPRPAGCLKLTGRDGWRVKSGDFRILYEINDVRGEVLVLHVGHRRDVYR